MDALSFSKATKATRYTQDLERRAASLFRGQVIVAGGGQGGYAPETSVSLCLSDGTQVSGMHRQARTFTVDCRDVRALFGNFAYDREGPNAITVMAGLEHSSSLSGSPDIVPIWFNGRREVEIQPGAIVASDPIPITALAGEACAVRTWVQVESLGMKWPQAHHLFNNSEGAAEPGTDTTATGGFVTGKATGTTGYGFAALIGTAAPGTPSVLLWGDSITIGIGNTTSWPRSWAEIALGNTIGHVNVSRHGDGLSEIIIATNKKRRVALNYGQGCTHAFAAYGVNDFRGGAETLAQVQAGLIYHWKLLSVRNLKVWQYTLPPCTTSTDSWATTVNQTPYAKETDRVALNTWLRDGAPILAGVAVATGSNAAGTLRKGQAGHPLAGIFETADTVESARNSGLWKANYTADGIHPIVTGYTAMAAAVNLSQVFS